MQFLGKYRARVVNINDPLDSGRIQVECPKVIGEGISAWALPCVPFANDLGGMLFMPKENDLVWIEFEEGNPDKPIWVGCFWKGGTCPVSTFTDRLIFLDEQGSYIKSTANGDILIHANRNITVTAERVDLP